MRRLACAIALLLACGGPEDDAEATGASTSTTSSSSSTSSITTSAESSGGDDGSSSGGPAPPDGIFECTETCTVPFDCCLPGTPGCPGVYPYNVGCKDDICVPGHCEDDEDCTIEGEQCHVVRGVPKCVMPCESDPEVCTEPNSAAACVGTTDDGLAICFERCDAPGVFCGNETCDVETGLCVCTSSGQCQFNETCVD